MLFGFFIHPISLFSFNIKAMEKWFLVRTTDNSLVLEEDTTQGLTEQHFDVPKEQKREIKKHKTIKMRNSDIAKLYLSRVFKCLYSKRNWDKSGKLNDLYEQGQRKVTENMDIRIIVQRMGEFQILLENTMMTQKTKYLIHHAA